MEIKNKKAYHKYTFLDTFIAGIVLKGSEVKSVRNNKSNFTDAYCYFKNDELWLKNYNIQEYKDSFEKHDINRDKKLLLTKTELRRLKEKQQEKGLTIVPTKAFFNDKNILKIEIALAKGKKEHDKRQIIKENDIKKQMDRELKKYL
jgi:SsrA-binding protein